MDRRCCLFCDEIPPDRLADTKPDVTKIEAAPASSAMLNTSNCHRSGPVTRNPYLNYLRHRRQITCAHSIIDMVRDGAAEWRKMTDAEKCPYVMEAHRAPRRYRRRGFGLLNSSMSSTMSRTMMNSTFDDSKPAVKRLNASARSRRRNRSMASTSTSGGRSRSPVRRSPRHDSDEHWSVKE